MLRIIATALLLMVTVAVDAAPLPFRDGRYVTDPKFCISSEEALRKYGDEVGAAVRNINGARVDNDYEMGCSISHVRTSNGRVSFRATCEAEGETEIRNAVYRIISPDSFAIGSRTFTRCGSQSKPVVSPTPIKNALAGSNDTCKLADVMFGQLELDIIKHEQGYESAIIREASFNHPRFTHGQIRGELILDRGDLILISDVSMTQVGFIQGDLTIDNTEPPCDPNGGVRLVKAEEGFYLILNGNTPVGTIKGRLPRK